MKLYKVCYLVKVFVDAPDEDTAVYVAGRRSLNEYDTELLGVEEVKK